MYVRVVLIILGAAQIALAMTANSEEPSYPTESEFREWVARIQRGESTYDPEEKALHDAQIKEAMEEYQRSIQGPPAFEIEDGIDAEFVAYIKEQELGFETDEQGRVIALGVHVDDKTAPLGASLVRLRGLKFVRDLRISENYRDQPRQKLTDDEFQSISEWTELSHLEVRALALAGRAFERLLAQNGLPKLAILRVNIARDSDLVLKAVRDCTLVREIELGNDVTDDGLRWLSNLQNLEILDLSYTQVTGSGMRHLLPLKKLRKLVLEETAMDDEGIAAISELSQLEVLLLGGPRVTVTDAGVAYLPNLTKLTSLSISDSAVTAAGLEPLSRLTHLRTLFIENTPIGDEAIGVLGRFKGLRMLEIGGTQLTPQGIRELRASLPQWDVDD